MTTGSQINLFISAVLKANAYYTVVGPRKRVAVESKRKLGVLVSHVFDTELS